nr:uncharacterized protein LOC108388231 isoform X8 [Manis javanica]XP_036847940.1 uncharacterized protein LOC108388231 isoform X8 [Manis javanica]
MWTLRSPLTRSRYVDMTSGPGGRKENHQAVTADAWPPRRRLPTAGRRNFGAGAWRQLSGQCQAYLVNKRVKVDRLLGYDSDGQRGVGDRRCALTAEPWNAGYCAGHLK